MYCEKETQMPEMFPDNGLQKQQPEPGMTVDIVDQSQNIKLSCIYGHLQQ